MDGDKFVLRGTREISLYVGINYKNFCYFVDNKKLPAFKIDGKGNWIALKTDLVGWVETQRDIHLR